MIACTSANKHSRDHLNLMMKDYQLAMGCRQHLVYIWESRSDAYQEDIVPELYLCMICYEVTAANGDDRSLGVYKYLA